MSYIISLQGPPGTGKSTFPLTLPGKAFIFDLEYGAERATNRYPDDKYTIFRIEPEIDEMFLVKGDLIQGQIKRWQIIANKYVEVLRDTTHQYIVFDTHKELWTINHRAELQRKQEIQVKDWAVKHGKGQDVFGVQYAAMQADDSASIRVQLQPMEYGDPNAQMGVFCDWAKSLGKNLILINHERDIYVPAVRDGRTVEIPSGKKELDGWSKTKDRTDWAFKTSMEPRQGNGVMFSLEILKSPIGAHLVGLIITDPTWDKIEEIVKAIPGG